MYTLTKQIAAVLLILGSIRDIRKRKPSGVDAVCSGNLCDDLGSMETGSGLVGNSRRNIDWSSLLGISKWTGEALGYADSGLILILGSYLGMWQLMILLLIAFSVAAFYAAMGMVIGNFHRKFFGSVYSFSYIGLSVGGVSMLKGTQP